MLSVRKCISPLATALNRSSAYSRMAESRSGEEKRQNDPGASVTIDNKTLPKTNRVTTIGS